MDRSRSLDAAAAAAIGLVKIAIAIWVLHTGFSHVSDDDYARTVISERFAHSPALDPSGTSWLPFPFWLTGSAMLVFGRSLEVARAVAIAAGALASAASYLALRSLPVRRWPALLGTLVAMALPWNAWLGAADVPEGFVAPLIVVGALTMNSASARTRWLGALALTIASLSRYEAWPVCAVYFMTGLDLGQSPKRFLAHATALAGPAAWMAWNLHAHGSATHFLTRVAAYRDAIGAGEDAFSSELWVYPLAFLKLGFEPLSLGIIALLVFCIRRDCRVRWSPALAACVSVFAFLIYGETRGGAPTHHPERALVSIAWILIVMGIDAVDAVTENLSKKIALAGATGAFVAWALTLSARYEDAPGRSEDENRAPQVTRGMDLRARDVHHVSVAPCAYEHFALIAAFGSPERVDTATVAPREAVARHPDATCPRVTEN